MAAKKARKTKKAPSANPAKGTRRILGSREAWGSVKRGAKKAGAAVRRARKRKPATAATVAKHRLTTRKPNGKTIIKAKRVTILNLTKKKNPPRKHNITSASDLAYAGTAKKATQDGVKGWQLGSKFFPGSATTKAQKITASAYLDLRTGDVWKRKAKGNPSATELEKAGRVTAEVAYKHDPNGSPQAFLSVAKNTRKALFPDLTLTEKVAFERAFKARLAQLKAIRLNPVRKKNIAGFMADGVFHPIRSGVEQRTTKSGTRRVKSKKAYKPSKVGETRTYSAKKSAKRAAQSKRMTAATKQRKATTTRLASRLLDRSGPKKTRRNPLRIQGVQVKLTPYKPGRTWGDDSRVKQSERGYRVALRRNDGRWWEIGHIKPIGGGKWEATYGDGYWMPAGSSAQGAASALISEVKRLDPEEFKSYYGQTRRNPNADTKSAYESFQGKPSTKSTSLNFPNGTPANVYKLGTLHSITLQSGAVVKPAGKTVWLCADTKGKLHLGTSGERLVNAPKGALGKVKEVEYITTKPHLGDNKPTRYYHELGEETGQKPTLYSDGAGGLVFKGGATYVRSDGIHN